MIRYGTTTVISFDGPLVPHAFLARIRTKYLPAPTPVALSDVALPPRSLLTRFVEPGADPASRTYDVGWPPAAPHTSVTVWPATVAESPPGTCGAAPHPDELPPTVSCTSFDGALTAALFAARTRM